MSEFVASSSVEEEADRLKAVLRDRLAERHPSGSVHDADRPAGHPSHVCPLCNANRFAHALAPELLEDMGRGLSAAGRLMHTLAGELRRHTAEHGEPPTDPEEEQP